MLILSFCNFFFWFISSFDYDFVRFSFSFRKPVVIDEKYKPYNFEPKFKNQKLPSIKPITNTHLLPSIKKIIRIAQTHTLIIISFIKGSSPFLRWPAQLTWILIRSQQNHFQNQIIHFKFKFTFSKVITNMKEKTN